MKFSIQLAIILIICLKGMRSTNTCELEYEDNFIRKVSLVTSEPIHNKSADLHHKKSETDEKAIVICNWNAKLQSKKDPCMYNEDDFSVTEPNLYTLSVYIKNNSYSGTFYFKRFSDIIDCLPRKETTKQKNDAMKNVLGIECKIIIVLIVVAGLKGYFL